jgi:hypothetical protein
VRALLSHGRLQRPSADFLLRLAEVLGQHSLTAAELKLLLQLLQQQQQLEEGEEEGFPYKSQIIHIISSIARGDGFPHSRQYFDIQAGRMLFNRLPCSNDIEAGWMFFNSIVSSLVHTRLVNLSKTRITPVLYINTVRSISEMFCENEK